MKNFNEIKQELQGIAINGANLGEENNVNLDLLTNHFDLGKGSVLLKNLEEFYLGLLNSNSEITSMEINDGKVSIPDGLIYHQLGRRISIDTLRSISQIGLIASEWFGILESEGEGRFCTFLDETRSDPVIGMHGRKHIMKENYNERVRRNLVECTIYFDKDNPYIKQLLSYDFFEYAKISKENPDKVAEVYPEWLQYLYKYIIEPTSQSGLKMHDRPENNTYTWHAIPGGIPPQFINGLCLNSFSKLNENLEELKTLFPNATIFNEDRTVVYSPQSQLEYEESLSELRSNSEQKEEELNSLNKAIEKTKTKTEMVRKEIRKLESKTNNKEGDKYNTH